MESLKSCQIWKPYERSDVFLQRRSIWKILFTNIKKKSLRWDNLCFFMLYFCANSLSHSSHLYAFTPVWDCITRCRFNRSRSPNTFPEIPHSWVFSVYGGYYAIPFQPTSYRKGYIQMSQLCDFPPMWIIFKCVNLQTLRSKLKKNPGIFH